MLRGLQAISARAIRGLSQQRFMSAYEGDGKTTVSVLNQENKEIIMVDSYSSVGFRLNNELFVIGPLAVFPKSVLQWNIQGPHDITEESLSLFIKMEPKLDILVVGIGEAANMSQYGPLVTRILSKHKIGVEVLPTAQACTTFNFLNEESRAVAAALIPPLHVPQSDEIYTSVANRKRLLLQD